MDTNDKIGLILRTIPEDPGVYRYFDKEGKIIYVGKAKNLRRRVGSYFNREHENAKTRVMVSKIADIQFMIVESEVDALLLENNFIKKYRPRYNILLKDDKTYPWICIKKEPFPRIFITRRKVNDGSEYFGPYPAVYQARTLLELIKDLFPLRTCNYDLSDANIAGDKFKLCLEYHIKNCAGPCQGLIEKDAYSQMVAGARNFIRGNFGIIVGRLKEEMAAYAAALEFEKAQVVKHKLDTLEEYQSRSTVINPMITNVDVFSVISDPEYGYVNYMKIHHGAVIQSYTLEMAKKLDETDQELLALAITELRTRFDSHSREIYLPFQTDISLGEGIKITVPQIGEKRKLIELSEKNAKFVRLERFKQERIVDPERHANRIMQTMKDDLQLEREPRHIECFDNSNIQGTNAVSACVVFRNGKPSKKDYRHFNVRTVDGPDDFATMKEAIERRYSRMVTENESLPDLLIVDGGKGQLSSAVETLTQMGLLDKIPVIGIAKRLEEIFYPNDPVPLYLDKRSETLRIIQQLRDEAHRFGITHHRNKRSKAALDSELLSIEGVGAKTAEELMRHFKSVKRLREASREEIEAVVGVSRAEKIWKHFEAHRI